MECRPLTKDERHFKSQIEIVKQFLDLIDEVEESPMSLNRYIKELKQRIIGEKHFFVEDDIIANSPQKVSKPAVLVSEDTNSTKDETPIYHISDKSEDECEICNKHKIRCYER